MKIKQILSSKLAKNSMWLFVLKIMNTVLPMLTIPYITRILGTSEYGVFSIALNWVLYFQVIVEYGFGLTGARKVALDNSISNIQKTFNNIISARIVLFFISLVLMNLLSLIFKIELNTYFCMNLLFIMVMGTTIQLTWFFQGIQDMKFITITDTIGRLISVLLIFLFVKSKNDIYLYCILYSITLLLSSIISLILIRKKYGIKYNFSSFTSIKEELIDGKDLFASAAATKIFTGIGVTILGFITTKEIIGIYSAINKIPLIMTYIFAPIAQAFYPYSSEQFKKSKNTAIKKLGKIFIPITLFYIFVSLIIIIFKNLIVLKVFGNEYISYSILIIPLIIQFIFAVINNFLGIQILVASGNQKSYSKMFIISSFSMLLLNILLGYFFNIYGVACANPIGELFLTILLLKEVRKLKKEILNEKD